LVFIALTIGTVASLLASLRKQISALRDSEERFRSLSDASFEGIMIHENGVILDVNLAFVRLFGYERPDELIGRSGPDLLLTPESRERVRHRINEAAEGVIELSGVRKDGVLVSAENESRAIRHRGRDARLVAWRDITERKRAEREKAKMEAQLLQAQKMEAIGRLTGGIAHDFNNLLTVINGYSNVLRRRLDGRQEGTLAEQIGKAGELAANLTRQLLAFSRMEVAHPELVGLNGIVTESLDMLKGLLGGQIEMNVGLGAAPDEVMADPNQIRQCLMNLVVNARDAMPAGGRLTIETGNADVTQEEMPLISGSAPGPHVRLTVTDSGIGMDEETSRRIFEPFFTTKKQGHGTGLGLSTVYGIVSQWRGGLKVVSEPGKGSQFSIYLPVSRVPPPPVERLDGVEAI
jgi:PAS domain S-box-containing protein